MTIRDVVYVLPEDTTGTGAYRLIWPALYLQKARPDLAHRIRVVPRKNRGDVLNGRIQRGKFGDGAISDDLPPVAVGTDKDGNVKEVYPPDDMATVVLQRTTHRYLVQSIPLWQRAGIRVVVDVDDALSFVHPGNQAAAGLRPREGHVHAAHHLFDACRLADVVTCTTPALAELYRRDAIVLPNYLPDGAFVEGRVDNTDLLWPAGMHSHPNDLDAIKGVLPWVARATGAAVKMLGQDDEDRGRYARLTGVEAEMVQPVGLPQWPAFLSLIGVGMVPLADTPFNHAKSKLKGIELAAVGVPFVASPRADYVQMHAESGLGILAATRNEWRRELKKLVTDDVWRKHVSEFNRAAAQKYRLREHAARWAAPWGLA